MKALITLSVDAYEGQGSTDIEVAEAIRAAETLSKKVGEIEVRVMKGARLVACFSPAADKDLVARLRDMKLDGLASACEAMPSMCHELRSFQKSCTPLTATAESMLDLLRKPVAGQRPSALLKALTGHSQISRATSDFLLALAELAER